MTSYESAIGQWLHRCNRCGTCKYIFRDYGPSCPSGEYYKLETYFASGRIAVARGLATGDIDWQESMLKPVFACTTCGSCQTQCMAPHREHIVDIIEELRGFAVDRLGPLPAHHDLAESIIRKHNPYNATHHSRQMTEQLHLPPKADTILFMGCTANYRENSIRDATISILRKAGIDFTIVDEYCCGSPLLRVGQKAAARDVAEHNLHVIEMAGAGRVVTSCAGCYRTLSKDYKNLGADLGIEVIHSSQLANDLLNGGKLKPKARSPIGRVTYHDPCHLGRHMGVYEEPRQTFAALPVGFVEMQPNRSNAWCCGAGGGVKSSFPELAQATASKRLEQARATNADVLVSACPFCKRNLSDANRGHMGRVLDLVELVDEMT